MEIQLHTLQSFVKDNAGGNAAGVVTDAEHLTPEQMQYIAKQAGYAETAFIQPSDRADVRLRFFTPDGEVDLCGHATVAAFTLLREIRKMRSRIYQETNAGILGVESRDDGTVFYEQTRPQFGELIDIKAVSGALNISQQDIFATGLQPQIVSTGMRDILVGIRSRAVLLGMEPNMQRIFALSEQHDAVSIHAFTLDTIEPASTAHCRNFAPRFGIPEEAATGSSNGALACLLFQSRKLLLTRLDRLIFEQGYGMQSPSEILAALETEGEHIVNVSVGGRAIKTGERTIAY